MERFLARTPLEVAGDEHGQCSRKEIRRMGGVNRATGKAPKYQFLNGPTGDVHTIYLPHLMGFFHLFLFCFFF